MTPLCLAVLQVHSVSIYWVYNLQLYHKGQSEALLDTKSILATQFSPAGPWQVLQIKPTTGKKIMVTFPTQVLNNKG